MWYESVVLGFFLARLSGGSATRFLFVVGGVVRRLAVGLPLFAALLSTLRLLLVLLSGLSGCCCAAMVVFSTGSVASTVVAAPGWGCPPSQPSVCIKGLDPDLHVESPLCRRTSGGHVSGCRP